MFPVYQNYKSHTIALSLIASCLTPYGGGLFSHSLKPTVVSLNCRIGRYLCRAFVTSPMQIVVALRIRTPPDTYRFAPAPCLDTFSQSIHFRLSDCLPQTSRLQPYFVVSQHQFPWLKMSKIKMRSCYRATTSLIADRRINYLFRLRRGSNSTS